MLAPPGPATAASGTPPPAPPVARNASSSTKGGGGGGSAAGLPRASQERVRELKKQAAAAAADRRSLAARMRAGAPTSSGSTVWTLSSGDVRADGGGDGGSDGEGGDGEGAARSRVARWWRRAKVRAGRARCPQLGGGQGGLRRAKTKRRNAANTTPSPRPLMCASFSPLLPPFPLVHHSAPAR